MWTGSSGLAGAKGKEATPTARSYYLRKVHARMSTGGMGTTSGGRMEPTVGLAKQTKKMAAPTVCRGGLPTTSTTGGGCEPVVPAMGKTLATNSRQPRAGRVAQSRGERCCVLSRC